MYAFLKCFFLLKILRECLRAVSSSRQAHMIMVAISHEDIPGPNHGEAQVCVCYELVGGRAWAGVTFLHWLVGTRTGVRSPDSRPLAAGRPATR